MTNAQIGAALGTTRGVIKNYAVKLYDKTGTHSRVELALWVVAREKR
jgi:DNA-binding NarL/FixJ family response regulator